MLQDMYHQDMLQMLQCSCSSPFGENHSATLLWQHWSDCQWSWWPAAASAVTPLESYAAVDRPGLEPRCLGWHCNWRSTRRFLHKSRACRASLKITIAGVGVCRSRVYISCSRHKCLVKTSLRPFASTTLTLHSLHLENFACQATVLHMPALSSVRESCSCRAEAKSFFRTSNLLAVRTWQLHTVFHTVSPGLWFFFLRCLSGQVVSAHFRMHMH